MVEQASKVDRLVSIDIAEKFEALQDEVELLKAEIKQTLVALREFLAKQKTVLPQAFLEMRQPEGNGVFTDDLGTNEAPPVSEGSPVATDVGHPRAPLQAKGRGSETLDAVMLANVISWLGTVKANGLCLHQITPYLEAYEASRYLTPTMVKVILRAMADLDQKVEISREQFSAQDYSDCLSRLHQIVCARGCEPESLFSRQGRQPVQPTVDMAPADENVDSTDEPAT